MNGSQFIPYRGNLSGYKIPKRIGARHFASAAFKTDADLTEEIKGLSTDIKNLVPTISEAKKIAEEAATKQKEMFAQLQELNTESKTQAEWRKEAEETAKKSQAGFNELAIQVKTIRENGVMVHGGQSHDFNSVLSKAIYENYAKKDERGNGFGISMISKSRPYSFEIKEAVDMRMNKAAANMTTAANLTGDPVITYVPTPVLLPRQLVNFRDLVPSFQSATGMIAIFRENYNSGVSPQEGAFGQQTTQGALKEQVGYDFTHVNFTANYIGGFVRISKQMLQDLPFLQTYLPGMLLRDYYKYENSVFAAAQLAASLGSTTTSGGNDAEKFLSYITNLETANFAPNGIVTTPAVWAKILQTAYPSTGTAYSTPLGFTYNPTTTNVEIVGIPVLKATWVPSGAAFIADWSQSQIATVDGLKVEFFEQDSDNVQRNLITVRVEARVVLITAQPYAFTYATGL